MKGKNYHEELMIEQTKRLREILACLPSFCTTVFRGIEPTTAPRTRIAYARDIKTFFEFLVVQNSTLKNKDIKQISLSDLNMLTAFDFEEYMEYLKVYNKAGNEYTNGDYSIKRKMSAVRVLFKYLYKKEMIDSNQTEKVDMPKLHEKAIIKMDPNETARFLDNVDYGTSLTDREKLYHEKTKTRDLALLTLMLGTGIRVSECVGLDINDVDFDNSRIKITRKGGYESFVYFGVEVFDALNAYLDERENILASEGHENALFLSSQKKRIGVRTVENMVKKYSSTVTPLKKITPHKLRSTYGTTLYKETGDIYLVADVLGHKDVNTTRKHYADIDDDRRRSAKDQVTLREKRK